MSSKENLILKIAKEHFFRFGYKKTSIEEIAKGAEIGKGTVYNYFQNKEELFVRCIEEDQEQMKRCLEKKYDECQYPDEKIVEGMVFKLKHIREMQQEFSLQMNILAELVEAFFQLAYESQTDLEEVRILLVEGEQEGIFKPGDHQANAGFLETIGKQCVLRWVAMEEKEAEKEIRGIYNLLLDGMRK